MLQGICNLNASPKFVNPKGIFPQTRGITVVAFRARSNRGAAIARAKSPFSSSGDASRRRRRPGSRSTSLSPGRSSTCDAREHELRAPVRAPRSGSESVARGNPLPERSLCRLQDKVGGLGGSPKKKNAPNV